MSEKNENEESLQIKPKINLSTHALNCYFSPDMNQVVATLKRKK
jgi:hypothetical protein